MKNLKKELSQYLNNQMKKEKVIKNLVNQFRGIDCIEAVVSKKELIICLYSKIELSFSHIISALNPFGKFEINSPERGVVIYMFISNSENYRKICKELKTYLYESVNEKFSEIEGFDEFDKNSQNNYVHYVKFLRTLEPDGLDKFSASQVLDNERFCSCGKELFNKESQTQAIFEFDSPVKIYEKLSAIMCEHD